MVLDQLDTHVQKVDLGTDCVPFAKFNSKWIVDLNAEHKIIKLEDRGKLTCPWVCRHNTKEMIREINNLDFIKIKNSALQETKNEMQTGRKYLQKKAHQMKAVMQNMQRTLKTQQKTTELKDFVSPGWCGSET